MHVPDYQELLGFIDLRAQAAEESSSYHGHSSGLRVNKLITSFASNAFPVDTSCIACKAEKHPLYSCSKFRSLSHPDKIALLKSNGHCLNCLCPSHFIIECKSLHHCNSLITRCYTSNPKPILHIRKTRSITSSSAPHAKCQDLWDYRTRGDSRTSNNLQVRQGGRKGSRDSPTAIETEFGWVLAGSMGSVNSSAIVSHHVSYSQMTSYVSFGKLKRNP